MQNGCTKGDPYSLYHDSGWQKGSHDGSTIITRKDGGAFEARRLLAHPTREKAATYKTVISHLTVELPEKALRYTNCPNVNKTDGVWCACGDPAGGQPQDCRHVVQEELDKALVRILKNASAHRKIRYYSGDN